jgi:hypothetical protein
MPYVNPYSIKNKDELAKKYPDFARRVGQGKKKKGGTDLEAILKALMGRQKRRVKTHNRKMGRLFRSIDPMGEPNLPPEEPASFGYAGGVLGGTGPPPGAPSSRFFDIASIGRHPMGIPETADPYGWNPSDMSGIVEDQRARDMAAMYPQPLGPDYTPMNTAPPMRQHPGPAPTYTAESEIDPFGEPRTRRPFFL